MRFKRIIPLFLPFFSLFLNKIYSQEQLGLRLDNYAGANAIALNPAANAATNPLTWDVNLAGAGFWLTIILAILKMPLC